MTLYVQVGYMETGGSFGMCSAWQARPSGSNSCNALAGRAVPAKLGRLTASAGKVVCDGQCRRLLCSSAHTRAFRATFAYAHVWANTCHIKSVLIGNDTMFMWLPTGIGKSKCFEFLPFAYDYIPGNKDCDLLELDKKSCIHISYRNPVLNFSLREPYWHWIRWSDESALSLLHHVCYDPVMLPEGGFGGSPPPRCAQLYTTDTMLEYRLLFTQSHFERTEFNEPK